MIFALHKFKHYLLGNKFVFYVDNIVLVYLVNKPHVLVRIVRWLLLFLEYDFTTVYKPSKACVVNVLGSKQVIRSQKRCQMLNITGQNQPFIFLLPFKTIVIMASWFFFPHMNVKEIIVKNHLI